MRSRVYRAALALVVGVGVPLGELALKRRAHGVTALASGDLGHGADAGGSCVLPA